MTLKSINRWLDEPGSAETVAGRIQSQLKKMIHNGERTTNHKPDIIEEDQDDQAEIIEKRIQYQLKKMMGIADDIRDIAQLPFIMRDELSTILQDLLSATEKLESRFDNPLLRYLGSNLFDILPIVRSTKHQAWALHESFTLEQADINMEEAKYSLEDICIKGENIKRKLKDIDTGYLLIAQLQRSSPVDFLDTKPHKEESLNCPNFECSSYQDFLRSTIRCGSILCQWRDCPDSNLRKGAKLSVVKGGEPGPQHALVTVTLQHDLSHIYQVNLKCVYLIMPLPQSRKYDIIRHQFLSQSQQRHVRRHLKEGSRLRLWCRCPYSNLKTDERVVVHTNGVPDVNYDLVKVTKEIDDSRRIYDVDIRCLYDGEIPHGLFDTATYKDNLDIRKDSRLILWRKCPWSGLEKGNDVRVISKRPYLDESPVKDHLAKVKLTNDPDNTFQVLLSCTFLKLDLPEPDKYAGLESQFLSSRFQRDLRQRLTEGSRLTLWRDCPYSHLETDQRVVVLPGGVPSLNYDMITVAKEWDRSGQIFVVDIHSVFLHTSLNAFGFT